MLLKYFNILAEEGSDSELISLLGLIPLYFLAHHQTAFQTSCSTTKSRLPPRQNIAMGQITAMECGVFAAPGL